jgi:hypothetical protein
MFSLQPNTDVARQSRVLNSRLRDVVYQLQGCARQLKPLTFGTHVKYRDTALQQQTSCRGLQLQQVLAVRAEACAASEQYSCNDNQLSALPMRVPA